MLHHLVWYLTFWQFIEEWCGKRPWLPHRMTMMLLLYLKIVCYSYLTWKKGYYCLTARDGMIAFSEEKVLQHYNIQDTALSLAWRKSATTSHSEYCHFIQRKYNPLTWKKDTAQYYLTREKRHYHLTRRNSALPSGRLGYFCLTWRESSVALPYRKCPTSWIRGKAAPPPQQKVYYYHNGRRVFTVALWEGSVLPSYVKNTVLH